MRASLPSAEAVVDARIRASSTRAGIPFYERMERPEMSAGTSRNTALPDGAAFYASCGWARNARPSPYADAIKGYNQVPGTANLAVQF
jgi:hypothetical protein